VEALLAERQQLRLQALAAMEVQEQHSDSAVAVVERVVPHLA
jgi:hypothetical protein